MTRKLSFLILTAIFLALTVVPSSAQIIVGISSFSTPFNSIGWDALNNRSARIPVSWTTQNRLVTSNLVFEQILPDGTALNVELPRLIPYVASNGDGVVAPILPDGATEITIRVSLVNLITGSVYDVEFIHLPIISGDTGSGDGGFFPAIVSFDAGYSAPLNPTELANGTARIPVSWQAINRPITANLVFDQVMPDGTAVNVELPRDFAWVNSSDRGLVAPVLPNEDVDFITLRVSLIDVVFKNLIDRRSITIPIQTEVNPPTITNFSSTVIEILDEAVVNSLIDVSWSVSNRPTNTNLVFEQILPDGSTRNAELPRDFTIVPSEGIGLVDPILPQTDSDVLRFQLRLVDLNNNSTLTSAEIAINLVRVDIGDRVVVTGNACYQGLFPPSQDLIAGSEGRIQYRENGIDIPVYSAPDSNEVINQLSAGDSITIQDAPYCSYPLANANNTSRRWHVLVDGQDAWIEEYNFSTERGYIYNFIRADRDDFPQVSVDSFTVSPMTVAAGELNTTTFTVTWETSNALLVNINQVGDLTNLDSGSVTMSGADVSLVGGNINFYIYALDGQNNDDSMEIVVPVQSTISISDFTMTPDTASGNEQITFTWDIAGDFENASIWAPAPYSGQVNVIHTMTDNSGTFTYTLPDNYAARDLIFTLDVQDNEGVRLIEDQTLTYTCAYQWGLGINHDQCPSTALISESGAYQTFQNGFMLWLPSSSESLWVFYNDGRVESYVDVWDGSDYAIEDTPPEGTFAPERGFGYLWQSNSAVRDGLGWATSSEQSYTINYQAALIFNRYGLATHYFQLPDGRVIRAGHTELGSALTWSNN